ncbi:MAG: phosphoserine phosphatase SerB, partial [Rhizobiales bacterium]|nr:phosphoserine phosphatase SerB [Hyphomicrobiales bacterium]
MPGLLTDAAVARCAALFGAGTAQGRWLAPREAWELDLGPVFDATGIAAVRAALDDAPVDANIVRFAPGERRKRLLVADMDSTMIGQECIDELAGYVGLKTHVTEITERAMRGEIAFEPALRERVALLKGLDASVIEDVLRERITLMPGGRALVATMRANGATACLVSGGFTGFVDRIASELGFDGSRANVLEIADGRLTGAVREPILGREAKLAALVAL